MDCCNNKLWTIIVTILSPLIIYWIINWRKRQSVRRELQNKLIRKQKERTDQFSAMRTQFKVTEEVKEILKLDWPTLLDRLQKRQLTAKQVLHAFTSKSLEATAFCNAVTEFNPRASKMADDLDASPQVKGPLHGIPFCVKDDTDVEGMDSTIGLAKNCFQKKHQSAPLIQALVSLGGIPFCKTNLPQILFSFGSDNPIFGQTTNSHNQKLGPGGSSSGTGALVGCHGAFFGTGTDIGGSVRIPAHCNGVAALKPTPGRLSLAGMVSPVPNIVGLQCTPGIIGVNAQVVSSVYKFLLENNLQSTFDPLMIPTFWNEKLFSQKEKPKLRIGYFTSQKFFPPIGDTVATIEGAVSALASLGHTVVAMEMPKLERFMRIEIDYIVADEGKALADCWEGEEIAKCMESFEMMMRMPNWVLRFASFLMNQRKIFPSIYSGRLAPFTSSEALTSTNLWRTKGQQIQLTREVMDEWQSLQLDALICPVMPCPAVLFDMPKEIPLGTAYAVPFNVINFPAGVVKFGVESGKNIDSYDCEGDRVLKLCKQACQESTGAPIGVQVVALPFQEEMALRVMSELENFVSYNSR